MQHRNLMKGSTGVKRFMLISAIAGAMLGIAAISSVAFHSAQPATVQAATARPAPFQLVAHSAASAAAKPAARPVAKPDAALARALRKFLRHQAASGMTAWTRSGIEQRNEAILVQARFDSSPYRPAALAADSTALAASARNGLAHPSPQDTAGWNKIMHDEDTMASELSIPSEGYAAIAQAAVIKQDCLAYTQATS